MMLVPRSRPRGVALVPALALLAVACGSSPRPATSKPERATSTTKTTASAPQVPVEITIRASRVGGSVRLDISGVGSRQREHHAMEQPRNWIITATAGTQELKRMVNGPVRVSREPVGAVHSGLWDTTVEFSVAFGVPAGISSMRVHIQPPGDPPQTITVTIPPEAAPEPAP